MRELTQFLGNNIRIIGTTHDPLWVFADVAKVLGYSNITDAARMLPDDERGVHLVHPPLGQKGGAQKMAVVTEFGLYRLILLSKRPEAEPFRKWIFGVIREIRLNGSYSLPLDYALTLREREQPTGAAVLEGWIRDRLVEQPGAVLDWANLISALFSAKILSKAEDLDHWVKEIYKLRPHWKRPQSDGIHGVARRLGGMKSVKQLQEESAVQGSGKGRDFTLPKTDA